MPELRVPPHNAEMELAVLGSMVFSPDEIPVLSAILTADDFYRADYKAVYGTLLDMCGNGMVIDIVTLKAELESEGLFGRVDGIDLLPSIARNSCPSVTAKYYAEEIKRLSESRQIIKALYDIITRPSAVNASDLRQALEDAENRQYVKSYAEKSLKNIDEYKAGIRAVKPRIGTGFKYFDRLTGGLRVPSLATFGAYPSVGKTAFALNIAAAQKGPVVFFSLEMSCEQIYERLACSRLKIDYGLFASQSLNEDQYSQVEEFTDVLKTKQVHVFDDKYYIEQQANVIAGIKPALVIVDYVQKVRTHHKTDSRRLEIAYISGIYKQLANMKNCVVIMLSQLARPGSMGNPANFRPTMTYLKEAGELEADSDYVGILHRPYVLCKDNPGEVKPEDGYVLIDKNKFGRVGQIHLFFDGKRQTFYEVDKAPRGLISGELPKDTPTPFDDEDTADG